MTREKEHTSDGVLFCVRYGDMSVKMWFYFHSAMMLLMRRSMSSRVFRHSCGVCLAA